MRECLILAMSSMDVQMASSLGTWFPTIFPDRCDGCEKLDAPRCMRFCPNGVFDMREGKAIVANPIKCVNGCNACEPICPHKAISFPKKNKTSPEDGNGWSQSLHEVVCTLCGKTFWTNTDTDTCFDCKRNPSLG